MRWALAWLLFCVGHVVSRPMNWFDWGWLYPAYNRLMVWSSDIQGSGPGPWEDVE